MKRVGTDSHVTLHYRLAIVAPGNEREIISTFGGRPATVQIGAGHMAPALEHKLMGLEEGQRAAFDLAPEEGFGERNVELVQTLTRAVFDENADPGVDYNPGDVVTIQLSDRTPLAGVLRSRDERAVVVDFNHPLAGQPLRFSVHVIGVI
jgi:FKBP-type peptidyl-prolyl cis-trans isomerase SlpA